MNEYSIISLWLKKLNMLGLHVGTHPLDLKELKKRGLVKHSLFGSGQQVWFMRLNMTGVISDRVLENTRPEKEAKDLSRLMSFP